jgi:hypothetical protein
MAEAQLAIKTWVSSMSPVVLRFSHEDTEYAEETKRLLEAGNIAVLCERREQFARAERPRKET